MELNQIKEEMKFSITSRMFMGSLTITIPQSLRVSLGIEGSYKEYRAYLRILDNCRVEVALVKRGMILQGYHYSRSIYKHWWLRLPPVINRNPGVFTATILSFDPPSFIVDFCK